MSAYLQFRGGAARVMLQNTVDPIVGLFFCVSEMTGQGRRLHRLRAFVS